MDEPVPIRRAAIGCLLLAVLGFGTILLVRPLIFSFAEPRDDSVVILGTALDAAGGPAAHEVVLSRSYGWDGERDAGDGRVQLTVIVAPSRFEAVSAVAGASPLGDGCALDIGADRLTDCGGHAWTFEGFPLDPADPQLDRFAVTISDGNIVVDLTRPIDA